MRRGMSVLAASSVCLGVALIWMLEPARQRRDSASYEQAETFTAPRADKVVRRASHQWAALPRLDPGAQAGGATERDAKRAAACRGITLAREFRKMKRNVFMTEGEVLASWLARSEAVVDDLRQFLIEEPPVSRLPLLESQPAAILDRMGALDALAAMARLEITSSDAEEATDALAAVANRAVAPGTDASVHRVRMGERFDAMSALANIDLPRAVTIHDRAEAGPDRDFLMRGMLRGLVLRGASTQAALDQVAIARSVRGAD